MTYSCAVWKTVCCPRCGIEHEVRIDEATKYGTGVLFCRRSLCPEVIAYDISRGHTWVGSVAQWTRQPNRQRREAAA